MTWNLIRNDKMQLVLRRPGEDDVVDVRVRRAFPLSLLTELISVRSSEGKELLMIDSLDSVTGPTRQLIDSSLSDTTFVPRVTCVRDVDVRFGYQEWTVETDRGPANFRVQEREDIRFMPDGRFRIKDADGNVYEMESLDALDARSRKAVEPLV